MNSDMVPFDMDNNEESGEGMFEIQLAEEIAICAVWLVGILVFGAAFKYYKAVFVLPNLIMQIIVLIATFIIISKKYFRL